jgi:AraC-like DNA-binding protein
MSAAAPLVRALVEATERVGIPRSVFLAAAKIPQERIADESFRFEIDKVDRLYTLALDMTGDEALGLHLAEHTSEAAFDLVGHLVTHAPTLRDALFMASEFAPIVFTDATLVITERAGVARVASRVTGLSPRAQRFQMDFAMAALLRLVRTFVAPVEPILAVYFEHRAPPNRHEYTRLFGSNVRFRSDRNAIEFPGSWLEQRALNTSDRLFALLLGEARQRLDSLEHGSSYRDRVERYLLSFPPSRIPSMETAAKDLGTSVRSLRRYLAAEGVSYRSFVKATLQRAAIELLRNPRRSIPEAAQRAGYSRATAFNRAFKRWTGQSPAEFRRASSGAVRSAL